MRIIQFRELKWGTKERDHFSQTHFKRSLLLVGMTMFNLIIVWSI